MHLWSLKQNIGDATTMSQSIPDRQSQEQDNLIKDTNVSGDLIIAPVQIGTKIETQTVQISVAKGTQQPLTMKSPYRGLKRFNDKDRDLFFGRDKLIAELFEMVNRSNLSLVLGASGSGKSSVVRAGLIPELKKSLESQTFYDFIFTPNQDPFDSLHRCLLIEEKDYHFSEAEVEIAREAKADTLTKVIDTLRKDGERWLIFVDQFEELFTICNDLDKRKNFIAGLVQVAKSGNSSVKIVLAMRADFLEQFSFYPDLGAIANQNNIHLVTEMFPDELRQAIEQPAAKHGVVFEEGLVEQIIKELDGQKGYLPLLQYTLKLLWESECQTRGADGRFEIEDRTLNKKSYAALEGVRGALQKRVNEIYKNLNQDEQKITKQIFLKLVNVVDTDSGSRTVSRRAYKDKFVDKSEQKLLAEFISKNLLVGSEECLNPEEIQASNSKRLKQRPTVEIAHEILLSSWDELKGWLEQAKEAIIFENSLDLEVERWQKVLSKDESRAKDELLKGTRLDQAVELRNQGAFENLGGLRPEESEFIDASVNWQQQQEQQKKNRRRNTIVSLATFSVISLGLASFAGIQLWKVKVAEQKGQESSTALIRSTWGNLVPNRPEKSYEECGTFIDQGLRNLYCSIKPFAEYRQLIAISGLPIFKKGPHTNFSLNFEGGYEFGHYNPEFLTWIQEKVVIEPADSTFKQNIQLAYNDKIKVVARAFYQTHKILFATPEGSDEFKAIKSEYQDKIEKQTLERCYLGGPEKCGGWYLQEKFRRLGDYLAIGSGGFWVRRSIDGTEQQFFDILTKLLEIYDSEWLDEQNLLDTNPSQLKPRNMIKKMTHDHKFPRK
ncbi:Peptidase C14, caspase catalytic subunit P20 [Microcystis aeruginosa PCC 9717]|uniref:Peptidase C14, caspase catalytic subunit P20 n=2 Tax=Microcystis aeruginosa TaxID=1126 RepID=I4FT10_MICAE|nr:Peptidase C14, caspase catalytic subunit P20 [Microcystis aeruginosa PCC 9717]